MHTCSDILDAYIHSFKCRYNSNPVPFTDTIQIQFQSQKTFKCNSSLLPLLQTCSDIGLQDFVSTVEQFSSWKLSVLQICLFCYYWQKLFYNFVYLSSLQSAPIKLLRRPRNKCYIRQTLCNFSFTLPYIHSNYVVNLSFSLQLSQLIC